MWLRLFTIYLFKVIFSFTYNFSCRENVLASFWEVGQPAGGDTENCAITSLSKLEKSPSPALVSWKNAITSLGKLEKRHHQPE